MNERREPTISAYSPSKEDMARQQAARGNKNMRVEQAKSSARSPAAKPLVAKSKMAPIAFVLALLSSAAAGFLYWQLSETQKFLSLADIRIVDLESKFELSDDESTASTQTMQAKLKWADSEIRKLWGVSHDTNRKAISVNKSNIDQVKKVADSAKNAVDEKINSVVKTIDAELRLVNDLVDAQQTSLNTIEQQNLQVVRDAQSLADKLNSLETSKRELERRIQSNEQAIEAIDAFRRNINQQLLQLKGGA